MPVLHGLAGPRASEPPVTGHSRTAQAPLAVEGDLGRASPERLVSSSPRCAPTSSAGLRQTLLFAATTTSSAGLRQTLQDMARPLGGARGAVLPPATEAEASITKSPMSSYKRPSPSPKRATRGTMAAVQNGRWQAIKNKANAYRRIGTVSTPRHKTEGGRIRAHARRRVLLTFTRHVPDRGS